MTALLELKNISHAYGAVPVVRGLSFKLAQGQIGCLLGSSGCGKTTVLRCIAGFEPVNAGEILLNGRVISRAGFRLPPEARDVGMVFQDYALFPHLTVAANVAFGLRRLDRAARAARVAELLETVGLSTAHDKYPDELSGGQQQRIALARALAPRPALLLLDEPFSNLDADMRERLSTDVRDILKRQNATAILVTHDQHEAFNLADEVGIMTGGTIEQWGTPYDLYHKPATRYVAEFIAQGVFLPGTVVDGKGISISLGVLDGGLPCAWAPGTRVDVLLRPDDVAHDEASPLQARVVHKAFRGAEFLYTLELADGRRVLSLVPSHHNHATGEHIGIRLAMDDVVAFPHEAGTDRNHQ